MCRVCGCCIVGGYSGDGCDLASTLCKYDLRKGDLFVLLLLLVAFRDLWKEWGHSNFQIFFTELPVPPLAAGVVGTF